MEVNKPEALQYSHDSSRKLQSALSTSFEWKLHYGINATAWSGKLEYENANISDLHTDFSTSSLIFRPCISSQWQVNKWKFTVAFGISYSELTSQLNPEPKLAIIRHLPNQQKLAINSEIQHKLQLCQGLFSSCKNAELPMMQSWKSTFTYEKNFRHSTLKSTVFYEDQSHVVADHQAFSALNILEEYPPALLSGNGKGLNMGLEIAFQHYPDQGIYYMVSGTLFDARYKTPGFSEWKNSRYNNQYILNATIGKEFDFSDHEKQKVLGINFQLVYMGGFWESPINLDARRIASRTFGTNDHPFSVQLSDVLKSNFRIYYKINHSKKYSLIGLDLSDVLNRDNTAFRYYDPYLDKILNQYQLGLIPMLSYVTRI